MPCLHTQQRTRIGNFFRTTHKHSLSSKVCVLLSWRGVHFTHSVCRKEEMDGFRCLLMIASCGELNIIMHYGPAAPTITVECMRVVNFLREIWTD